MDLLKIIKLSTKTWKHNSNIDGDFILTKFYAKQENTDFLLVESYGAKRRKYKINEIEVYNIGGTAETFTNFEDLFLRLEELNYPAFYVDGEFIFNPSNYDLEDFTNESLNLFVREDELNFLSNNPTTYPTATTPIADTDQLFVIQGGVVKKVDKSEIGGGGFIISNTQNSPVLTGTTSVTILVSSILIPGGTFTPNDQIIVEIGAKRIVPTSGNSGIFLSVAPIAGITDPFVGGLQSIYKWFNPVITGTNLYMNSQHIINISSTQTTIYNTVDYNNHVQGSNVNVRSIDWSVDQWVYILANNVQLNTQTTITSYLIERKRST